MKINYLINIVLVLVGSIFWSSCIKDKGTYEYSTHEKITIEGIEESYDKMSGIDRITLNPKVSSSDAAADLKYVWVLLPKDTLSTEKDVDYLITKEPGDYTLRLQVTNTRTKYSEYKTAKVNIGTEYTRGWYVAKSNSGKTDVDLFLTAEGRTNAERRVDGVFSLNNGRELDGQPLIMTFFPHYSGWDGVAYSKIRTLFVVAERDMSAINIENFKELRSFDDLFYVTPSKRAPSFFIDALLSCYAVNAGQLYAYSNSSANNGQFGPENMIDDKDTPYYLSKYFLGAFISNGGFFFDEISSSFVAGSSSGGYITKVSDSPSTDMPANKNNKELLYMGLKQASPQIGYAIFQDKTDPSLKILSQVTPDKEKFMIKNDTLKSTDKLYNASRYMVLDGDENIMFFVVGNEVWSRNLSNGAELLQYTAPVGEKITLLRHKKYALEPQYTHNYVAIGTSSAGKYKVRMFEKSAGRLAENPTFTMEGEGDYVGDIMYVGAGLQSWFTHNATY